MRVSSIRWGIVWIGIGFLFLAINFEVLDSLVFPRLFSLWPVLLIAVGVELIFRRTRLYFLALISPLLIAAAFILAATYGGGYAWSFDEFWRDWSWRYSGEKEFSGQILLEAPADTIDIVMDLGQADFSIASIADRSVSVEAVFHKRSPQLTSRLAGTTEFISYENRETAKSSILGIRKTDLRGDFVISDELPLKVNLSTELEKPIIDFSNLRLLDLDLFMKSDEAVLRLGEFSDSIGVTISGKSKVLEIFIPEGIGLEFQCQRLKLCDQMQGERLTQIGTSYMSDGFDQAERRVIITMNARIGFLAIGRE